MSPPNAFVTGNIPTTTANNPIFAQILAKDPVFSRSFWSSVREGSMDQ